MLPTLLLFGICVFYMQDVSKICYSSNMLKQKYVIQCKYAIAKICYAMQICNAMWTCYSKNMLCNVNKYKKCVIA